MAESIKFGKIVGQCKRRVFLVEIGQDLESSWWDLEEERMVNEFDKAVERELSKRKNKLLEL